MKETETADRLIAGQSHAAENTDPKDNSEAEAHTREEDEHTVKILKPRIGDSI